MPQVPVPHTETSHRRFPNAYDKAALPPPARESIFNSHGGSPT